jgi:hypothetical protein
MEHRHLVPKDRDFYRIRVGCRAAAQDPQNPPDDQQRDRMNHHTTEPAAPKSAQARAITLKWHPSASQRALAIALLVADRVGWTPKRLDRAFAVRIGLSLFGAAVGPIVPVNGND